MRITPELLRSVAVERLRSTRPELAADLDLSAPGGLGRARTAIAGRRSDGPADTAVVAVIGRFSLPQWVCETCRFALSVPADRAGLWRRSFTRTIHLAGRPDNLRGRFAFDHVADDGSMAWIGPDTDQATTTLRRLLKTFEGASPLAASAPFTVEIPAPALARAEAFEDRPVVHRDLYVATAGVSVSEAMIHLNHLLAEAVLDGLIRPGGRLTLRSVPRLAGLAAPFAALRVDADVDRVHDLRAYAGLTEET